MVALSILGAVSAHAVPSLSKADYRAHKLQIAADYKAERDACNRLTANDKEVCITRAKGHDKVANAELDYNNTGDPKDANRLTLAKADAGLNLAREQCEDRRANEKPLCLKEADVAHAKALTDARLARQVAEAERDAGGDKREVDARLAIERCQTLAGAAKTGCLGLAKARFGKP